VKFRYSLDQKSYNWSLTVNASYYDDLILWKLSLGPPICGPGQGKKLVGSWPQDPTGIDATAPGKSAPMCCYRIIVKDFLNEIADGQRITVLWIRSHQLTICRGRSLPLIDVAQAWRWDVEMGELLTC